MAAIKGVLLAPPTFSKCHCMVANDFAYLTTKFKATKT